MLILNQASIAEEENDTRFTQNYIIDNNYPALRMILINDRIDRADDTVVFI